MQKLRHAVILNAYLARLTKADMDHIVKKMDDWTLASLNYGSSEQAKRQAGFFAAVANAVDNMTRHDIGLVENIITAEVNAAQSWNAHVNQPQLALALKEGYAEDIIDGHPEKFDAVEIHGCREYIFPDEPQRNFVEQDEENPQFFSVYLHCVEGGIYCIGDFATMKQAEEYAKTISDQYSYNKRRSLQK